MVVSSGTGLVLDKFVTKWEGFGGLAIVISGEAVHIYIFTAAELIWRANRFSVARSPWFYRCHFRISPIYESACKSRIERGDKTGNRYRGREATAYIADAVPGGVAGGALLPAVCMHGGLVGSAVSFPLHVHSCILPIGKWILFRPCLPFLGSDSAPV